ncbi:MAG: hypothetical protein WC497_05675 [Patescibacteria group bacterium]
MSKRGVEQLYLEGMERRTEAPKVDAKDQIRDAGRQRLDAIKGGFRSFKEGLMSRFRGMGKKLETGIMYALGAPEAAKAGGRATKEFAAGQYEAGKKKAGAARDWTVEKGVAAKDWTVATGAAARDKAVDTGRAIGRGARTGAKVAVGATLYGAEKVGQGVKAGYEKGRETVGAGKEWIVDRATDIHDRAMAARDTFASRVEGIRDDYQQRLAERQAQREKEPEFAEYQKLSAQRQELLAAVQRLLELEGKFGSQPTE